MKSGQSAVKTGADASRGIYDAFGSLKKVDGKFMVHLARGSNSLMKKIFVLTEPAD